MLATARTFNGLRRTAPLAPPRAAVEPTPVVLPKELDHADLRALLAPGGKAINRGAVGEGVKRVQAALTRLGYRLGGADGHFGDNTERAVKAFQRGGQLFAFPGQIDAAT